MSHTTVCTRWLVTGKSYLYNSMVGTRHESVVTQPSALVNVLWPSTYNILITLSHSHAPIQRQKHLSQCTILLVSVYLSKEMEKFSRFHWTYVVI